MFVICLLQQLSGAGTIATASKKVVRLMHLLQLVILYVIDKGCTDQRPGRFASAYLATRTGEPHALQ